MAFSHIIFATLLCTLFFQSFSSQLSPTFYDETCPAVTTVVRGFIEESLKTDPRIAASLLRLHFHDCFVNGCDASVLLDKTDTIDSEKGALANIDSLRGFEVIDSMKSALEEACPGVVSCADIVAVAAEESVFLSGGPTWKVPLGRRDSFMGNRTLANLKLPKANESVEGLKQRFAEYNLDTTDLVALSGGHTIGRASCLSIGYRLYDYGVIPNVPDPTLDPTLAKVLGKICPEHGDERVLTDLDPLTPNLFDNKFFANIHEGRGIVQSDQVLYSTPGADTVPLVNKFLANETAFFESFVVAMIKMANISVLTGTEGEIRLNCHRVNGDQIIEESSEGSFLAE